MSFSLPPFSSLLFRCCNVSWVPAVFFISFYSGLFRFPPCFSDVAMFHEFQPPYSSFLSVPACYFFLPASQLLQSFMSSSRILHFFPFQPALFSFLLLRCCNVSWVPAIFFISFSSGLLRFLPCFSDVEMFHEFQQYWFKKIKKYWLFLSFLACSVFLAASQMLQCFMSSSHSLHFLQFRPTLLYFPPCFSYVAMFHEFQPYSSFLSVPACSVFLPVSLMLQCFMSSSLILHFFQLRPATFSSQLLRCRISWVLAILIFSFSSGLLCFPSCFSDVAKFHEFQPYIFFTSFSSGLLRFPPWFSDDATFHEFQPYSSFRSVPACYVFLPASHMLQCFMRSSHILNFFQFQPATFSSLLLRWCNLSWVPAIIFISFSSGLLCFSPWCCTVSWVPAVLFLSFSSSLLLVVLQCFMSSRLRYFPHCFMDATIGFYSMSFRMLRFPYCFAKMP